MDRRRASYATLSLVNTAGRAYGTAEQAYVRWDALVSEMGRNAFGFRGSEVAMPSHRRVNHESDAFAVRCAIGRGKSWPAPELRHR